MVLVYIVAFYLLVAGGRFLTECVEYVRSSKEMREIMRKTWVLSVFLSLAWPFELLGKFIRRDQRQAEKEKMRRLILDAVAKSSAETETANQKSSSAK